MLESKKTKLMWGLYLPVLMGLLYFIITDFMWTGLFSRDYIILLTTAMFVSFFPISVSDTVFSLVTGISMITFIIFGLLPELLLTSIAFIILMIRIDLKFDQDYLCVLNLFSVAILSVVSAGAYYGAEALLGIVDRQHYTIIPLVAYVTVYVLSNHLIYYGVKRFLAVDDSKSAFLNKKLLFSLATNYALLPFFYILLYLYSEVGSKGLQVGVIPLLTFVAGLYMWSKSETSNYYLRQVNKATERLTENIFFEDTINCFIDSLISIFLAEQVYYYEVNRDQKMRLERFYHKKKETITLHKELDLAEDAFINKMLQEQIMTTNYLAADYITVFGGAEELKGRRPILLPVHALNQNKGFIIMVRPRNLFFEEYLGSLLENFNRSFINVLENAVRFENLQESSYTDHLTGLPNLRFFLNEFQSTTRMNTFKNLSIIVLDLDYFSKLNDHHGHEAGNEVLSKLGKILKSYKSENTFVARYGGEEFVLLLEDYCKEEAFKVAEAIRKEIEETVFSVTYSMKENKAANLSVTASLGVATSPEDCEGTRDLIALADQAMYLGSKKGGRNRVTAYNKDL